VAAPLNQAAKHLDHHLQMEGHRRFQFQAALFQPQLLAFHPRQEVAHRLHLFPALFPQPPRLWETGAAEVEVAVEVEVESLLRHHQSQALDLSQQPPHP